MRRLALLFAFCSLIVGAHAQPLPLPGADPIHVLTLTADDSGQITLAGYDTAVQRGVPASLPAERYVEALQAGPGRDLDIAAVELIDDATSAVVFRTVVAVPRWIRGETALDPQNRDAAGPDGSNIVGHHLPWTDRTFGVRVPVIAGANRLAVSLAGAARGATVIDLAAAAAGHRARGTRDVTLIPLAGYDNGDPANRLDIVILGDGYRASQQAKFIADAAALADGLFDFAPYSRYRRYFNVVAVFGASEQSGADQPPYQAGCAAGSTHPIPCCPIGPGNTEAMNGSHKDTRYDTTFCYGGIARLMVATDFGQMYADATAAYPDWDEIFLVANDQQYGGSGGAVAAVSVSPYSVQILHHEAGHSLMRLDDEYSTYTPGYPPCSDRMRQGITTPCRPNVTDQTQKALIKWTRWISPGAQPDPNPSNKGQIFAEPGLWIGAHYQPDTYYRPCNNCTMRSLGTPFGPVASEQLPIALYHGGWEGFGTYWGGADAGGVDIIEPATVTPDPLAPVFIPAASSQAFSFDVLSPTGGKHARVRWMVNGTLVREEYLGNQGTASFAFAPIITGSYTVTAEVTDVGGVLHATQASVSRSTRTWAVTAEGYAGTGTELVANGGFETPKKPGAKQPLDWTIKNKAKSKMLCGAGAFEDDCLYALQGKAGSTVTLKQSLTAVGDAGDAFVLSAAFDTFNLKAKFKIIAKIKPAGGPAHTLKLDQLPRDKAKVEGWFVRETSLILGPDSPDIASIRLQLKFPHAGGKLHLDALSLMHYDEYLTAP